MEKELTKQDNINKLVSKLDHGQSKKVTEAIADKCKVNPHNVATNWFAKFKTPKKYQDDVINILQIFIQSNNIVEKKIEDYDVVFEEVKGNKE